jgi:hypothetical protein
VYAPKGKFDGILFTSFKYTDEKISQLSVFFLIGIVGGGAQLGPLATAATNRPNVSAPGDYDDGEIGGIIGRGNRSTWRKPAPVPLYPPQTPHAAQLSVNFIRFLYRNLFSIDYALGEVTAWVLCFALSWGEGLFSLSTLHVCISLQQSVESRNMNCHLLT